MEINEIINKRLQINEETTTLNEKNKPSYISNPRVQYILHLKKNTKEAKTSNDRIQNILVWLAIGRKCIQT